jgi:hypothetical protein
VQGAGDAGFAFSAASYTVNESGGSARITIVRSGDTSGATTIRFSTANGSASAGKDYGGVSKIVSFSAGQISKSVSVPIFDRGLISGAKTLVVSLSDPGANAVVGSPGLAVLTILDNDATVAFSHAQYSVNAAYHLAKVTLRRSGNTAAISVLFKTANGSAIAGRDYKAVSKTVNFPGGAMSRVVSILILNHRLRRSATVRLSLSEPKAGARLGARKTATLTIVG